MLGRGWPLSPLLISTSCFPSVAELDIELRVGESQLYGLAPTHAKKKSTQNDSVTEVPHPPHIAVRKMLFHIAQ